MNKYVVLILIQLSTVITASASGGAGNGGGVHFCPNRDKKVEFYDLYEGKNSHKEPIPVFETSFGTVAEMQEVVLLKIEKINPFFSAEVRKQLRFLHNPVNFLLGIKKKLKQIPDANYLWVDEDCTYEQLASWDDEENLLYISNKFYDEIKKNDLDLAAFEIHEAVYKAARVFMDVENSDIVRKFVAYLFSPIDPPKKTYVLFGKAGPQINENQNIFMHQENKDVSLSLGKFDQRDVVNSKIKIRLSIAENDEKLNKHNQLSVQLLGASNKKTKKRIEAEKLKIWIKDLVGFFKINDSTHKLSLDQDSKEMALEMDYDLSISQDVAALSQIAIDYNVFYIMRTPAPETKLRIQVIKECNGTREVFEDIVRIVPGYRGFDDDGKLVNGEKPGQLIISTFFYPGQ